MKTAVDNQGRTWHLVERCGDFELWKTQDSSWWGVCLEGDEPDHASFSQTCIEETARAWLQSWVWGLNTATPR